MDEPRFTKLNTLAQELHRENDRKLKVEPRAKYPRTDISLAPVVRHACMTLNAEPKRKNDRTDKLLPIWK
jgi:hypothetical protein